MIKTQRTVEVNEQPPLTEWLKEFKIGSRVIKTCEPGRQLNEQYGHSDKALHVMWKLVTNKIKCS